MEDLETWRKVEGDTAARTRRVSGHVWLTDAGSAASTHYSSLLKGRELLAR